MRCTTLKIAMGTVGVPTCSICLLGTKEKSVADPQEGSCHRMFSFARKQGRDTLAASSAQRFGIIFYIVVPVFFPCTASYSTVTPTTTPPPRDCNLNAASFLSFCTNHLLLCERRTKNRKQGEKKYIRTQIARDARSPSIFVDVLDIPITHPPVLKTALPLFLRTRIACSRASVGLHRVL